MYQNEKENAFEYVIKDNKTENCNVNLAPNSTSNSSDSSKFISLVKWNDYSSYYELLNHIAWTLKLKWNQISYKRIKEHKSLPFANLNTQDIDCAENKILKHCQFRVFWKWICSFS